MFFEAFYTNVYVSYGFPSGVVIKPSIVPVPVDCDITVSAVKSAANIVTIRFMLILFIIGREGTDNYESIFTKCGKIISRTGIFFLAKTGKYKSRAVKARLCRKWICDLFGKRNSQHFFHFIYIMKF